jgi:hypothetical protein
MALRHRLARLEKRQAARGDSSWILQVSPSTGEYYQIQDGEVVYLGRQLPPVKHGVLLIGVEPEDAFLALGIQKEERVTSVQP